MEGRGEVGEGVSGVVWAVGGLIVGGGGGARKWCGEEASEGVAAAFFDGLEDKSCEQAAVVGSEGEGSLVC